MDCLAPSPNTLEPIIVVEWISREQHVTHTFNKPGDNILLYPDDSFLRVIQKVVAVLGKTSVPYVWNKRTSLLFSVKKTTWDGYKVNPFETSNQSNAQPVLLFAEKHLLGDITRFNIVFKENISRFAQDQHYFPEWNTSIPNTATIIREENVLKRLLQFPTEEHEKLQRKNQGCTYTHIVFKGTPYKRRESATFLEDLFERLHTDAKIPFIQWMDDSSKVLYKVYKDHTISKNVFDTWTAAERLPKVSTSLILYSPIGKRNVYARVYINLEGDATITYHMDARDKVDWNTIIKHKEYIVNFIATFTGIKYDIRVHDISVRSELVLSTTDAIINSLGSFMSGILPVFHVTKVQNGKIHAIYKRAQNYTDEIQLSEYIRTKLDMGVPVQEIVENLNDMGIPPHEIAVHIEQAQTMMNPLQQPGEIVATKKIETGTIVLLAKVSYGIRVYITNAASIDEVKRLFHWIRACILYLPQVVTKKKPQTVVRPLSSSSTSSTSQVPVASQKSSSSSRKSSSKNDLEESLSSEDLGFLDGGAVGKEHQRYFLNMLQEADPALFSSPDNNYARMCQASAFHQPVVMSLDEKEKMMSEGYGEAIDNMVTYGSDANNQNAYFCPRIWCPVMKRPITYETYVRNGNKCPGGEEAKLMYEHPYWGNSHETQHYIGFHKNKTSSGLCLPCCYVKKLSAAKEAECKSPLAQQQQDVSARSKPKSKSPSPKSAPVDDTYLMTQVAPLPEGRSGNIPQILHEIISPNVTYQLCSKTVTSQQCPVRHGIVHQKDSLMNAIAYSLSKTSKKEVVALIKRKLNPLTFLSLENGNVVAAFVENGGMNPNEHSGLVKELQKHLAKYPAYVKALGLDNMTQSQLARELQLYMAWLKYFAYLESDEVKSPHHLYDLFHKLGYLLLIWDKENSSDIQLRCPMYSCVSQLLESVDQHRNTIVLLYENGVYEPIEIRKRNTDPTRIIDTKFTTTIDDALRACSQCEDDIIAKLGSLREWVASALFMPKAFELKTCVVSPDLQINYFLTGGNCVVRIPQRIPIRLLPQLIDDVGISRVIYEEDIADTVEHIELLRADFDLFARKLQSIGFGFDIGQVTTGSVNEGYYNNVLTFAKPTTAPIITLALDNEFTEFIRNENATQKKWHQLQTMISKTFLDHYDTLVQPTLTMTREERVRILSNTFPSIPNKKMLLTAIEEMPLEHGKIALMAWQRSIGREEKYPFFKDTVKDSNKEWIFSQQAVENGNMTNVATPVAPHGARPLASHTPMKSKTELSSNRSMTQPSSSINSLRLIANTTKTRLPSKWTQMRSYEWAKYNLLKQSETNAYDRMMIPELIAWIAEQKRVPVVWGDIEYIRYKYVVGALQDKELMIMLLDDPSISHAFSQVLGKSYKQSKILWERGFAKRTHGQMKQIWNDISTSNTLWASDLDLHIAAKLLDITILVLHRSKYGVSKEDRKRGDFDDLSVSTSLYTRLYTKEQVLRKPLCILYKDTEEDHAVYIPIVDESGTFLFKSLYYCPADIRALVDFLIANRIYPSYE